MYALILPGFVTMYTYQARSIGFLLQSCFYIEKFSFYIFVVVVVSLLLLFQIRNSTALEWLYVLEKRNTDE